MISNADTPFIRDLYRNYSIHEVYASRNINCEKNGRASIKELIITNW